jgi:hypothetical protein
MMWDVYNGVSRRAWGWRQKCQLESLTGNEQESQISGHQREYRRRASH